DDFVGSAVPAYCKKIPMATFLRLAYKFRSVPCGIRFGDFDLNSARAQLLKRRRSCLSAASATSSRIHNREKTRLHAESLDGNYRRAVHCCANPFGQGVARDFQRSRAREIARPNQATAYALEIRQTAIALENVRTQFIIELRVVVEPHHQDELRAWHCALGPDVIRSKDAEFLHGNSLKRVLDVFGIDILAAFGDHHVFLAPEKL